MTLPCAPQLDAALVPTLMGSVNCAADGLLVNGYAALAAPGGPVETALTGALTLFVGFYAYRLLLGRARLDVGQAAVMVVKIGLVLVLASNWAVYQQVVAHTLFDAPRALAELILGGLDRRGTALSGTPMEALQQVFDELVRDTRSLSAHAGERSPLLGGPAFATMVLNASAYLVVMMSAGVLAAVRLGLALFLALGPVVAGLLLFRGTRGLVEGWLRAMVALATVSLMTMVLLPVEFTVLEPSLLALAHQRAQDAVQPETALAAVFVIAVFAIAQLAATIAALMFARGLSLPGFAGASGTEQSGTRTPAAPPAETSMPRVDRIAQAAAASDRRHTAFHGAQTRSITDALGTTERVRHTQAMATGAAASTARAPQHLQPRAVRPRRELLVSRRKR